MKIGMTLGSEACLMCTRAPDLCGDAEITRAGSNRGHAQRSMSPAQLNNDHCMATGA
jgi:hypothetical protein